MSARRIKVKAKGTTGIYYREGSDGERRYEIDFYDQDGARRWKVIDGDLEQAKAAREEMRRRRRDDEPVCPPTATFSEVADAWLTVQSRLRPRTREIYTWALEKHLRPRLGTRQISKIREADVLRLIAEMREEGKAEWTIKAVLTPFGRIMAYAVRNHRLRQNPVRELEREERPKVGRPRRRVLSSDEISNLLEKATPRYRPVFATAVFTGLRLGELLGLTWADIDFDAGFVQVRKQLSRGGERVEPKTEEAIRDVVMMPSIGKLLREHKLRSETELTGDSCPVFSTATGQPLYFRNVSRALSNSAELAGLIQDGTGPVTMHTFRRTFASHLILDLKLDAVQVAGQMGHADPAITYRTYADLFDRARHSAEIRQAMADSAYGTILERSAVRDPSPPADKPGQIVPIRAVSGTGGE